MRFILLASLLLVVGCNSVQQIAPTSPPEVKPQTVVFIGDSVTWRWGTENLFLPNWTNQGVIGDTSSQVLARFEADVLDVQPTIVHILAGTNDLYPGWNESLTESNLTAMIQGANAHRIRVILGTVPPWGDGTLSQAADSDYANRHPRITLLNQWIQAQQSVCLVDYFTALSDSTTQFYQAAYSDDGIHPNHAGSAAMQAALTKSGCL